MSLMNLQSEIVRLATCGRSPSPSIKDRMLCVDCGCRQKIHFLSVTMVNLREESQSKCNSSSLHWLCSAFVGPSKHELPIARTQTFQSEFGEHCWGMFVKSSMWIAGMRVSLDDFSDCVGIFVSGRVSWSFTPFSRCRCSSLSTLEFLSESFKELLNSLSADW